ncbi:MAG TPA: chromosome segregation protein SMC [Candidatus Dormibacteraeota bacterium]|nr:chromosome segregation protein SMC [Candidatus Dormibacteraeota bacterium]
MRLRRVTLSGFKTFARRSEIALDPGLTAVVGPNGSGKSNLVDAIRWALGETNARELRGARMDEVIYAGGQGRAPMGMAQVELILDNDEGRLPLDDVEVSISRRVTRGGESEYRLNGSRIRLRDVERILSATGLTQNGYAVVAQNDVDGIIEANPQQRRALVEEAAGVRGLRAAREDGVGRVSVVETRLLRLADLLADAEPRLEELESQARVAREHRELAGRLAELRGSLAREEWRAARALMRRAKQRLLAADSRAESAQQAEAAFMDRLDGERAALASARAAQANAAGRLEGARVAAERAAGDRRRWADRATSALLARAAAAADMAEGLRELAEHRAELAELARSGEHAEATLVGLEARNAALRAEYEDAEAGLEAANRRSLDAQTRLAAAEAAAGSAVSDVRDQRIRAEVLNESMAGLRAEVDAARARAVELRRRAADAAEHAEHLQGGLAVLLERTEAARDGAEQSREALVAAEGEEAQANSTVREAGARLAAIRGQIAGALGGSGAVGRAIESGEISGGRLVQHLRVADAADQPAIEAALEDHLAAWLVDDFDAAARLLDGDGGREEILAAGIVAANPVATPPGVRAALDALRLDQRARGAVSHLLAGVWLAPNRQVAGEATAAGGVAVLPDGTVVGPAGVRGGGRPGRTMALAADERTAAAADDSATRAYGQACERSSAARARLSEAEQAASRFTQRSEAARHDAAEATTAAAGAESAASQEERRVDSLLGDRAAREEVLGEVDAAAKDAELTLAQRERELAEARQELVGAQEAAAGGQAGVDAAWAELRQHELDAARAEPEARAAQRRLAFARQAVATAEQRGHGAEVRLLAAEEVAVVALARGRAAARVLESSDATVDAARRLADDAAAPAAAAEAAVLAVETERADVAVATARALDERSSAEADLALNEARVADLAEAVRDDELDEGPEPEADAAEKAEREITRLERRIAALGPVNALAPEQYDALDERVRRLRRDHDDLATSCIDLRLLAGHLSTEIERRFDAVFGAVAYHFRMLFEELFPGGRATLRLQEPVAVIAEDDAGFSEAPAAEPGVEILAQPAGKRLQALSLLSGGERALTALAVILALQQVNPSPFYVFDEVDAPLDDANIGRFTRLLRRLARTQQFLVVTHNHATMAAAEALYGVTLESDGTSRLISVRLVAGEPVPHLREAALAAL